MKGLTKNVGITDNLEIGDTIQFTKKTFTGSGRYVTCDGHEEIVGKILGEKIKGTLIIKVLELTKFSNCNNIKEQNHYLAGENIINVRESTIRKSEFIFRKKRHSEFNK